MKINFNGFLFFFDYSLNFKLIFCMVEIFEKFKNLMYYVIKSKFISIVSHTTHVFQVGQRYQFSKLKTCKKFILFRAITYLFHDGGPYHIERRSLICSANQWTSFYMIRTFVTKKLISVTTVNGFSSIPKILKLKQIFSK